MHLPHGQVPEKLGHPSDWPQTVLITQPLAADLVLLSLLTFRVLGTNPAGQIRLWPVNVFSKQNGTDLRIYHIIFFNQSTKSFINLEIILLFLLQIS